MEGVSESNDKLKFPVELAKVRLLIGGCFMPSEGPSAPPGTFCGCV